MTEAIEERGAGQGSGAMRRIDLEGSAEEMGHQHGETYRDEIRAYAEDRVALSPFIGESVNVLETKCV